MGHMLSEPNRRVSSDSCKIQAGLSALGLKHLSFADQRSLLPMALCFGITEDNLAVELHQVGWLIERKNRNTLGHAVNKTMEFAPTPRPWKDVFIDRHERGRIAVTLIVSSASCERRFSCLRRLRNVLEEEQ
ncbi:hypothetical protein AAFF_G00012790 [Aldrovandia affinis]|uniref:HAT C-terminal dimerisation domain-containing protein n=1 Tax=Aldrovandia affinis TaxID=143900 RepID=A0AAD7WH72_9TELE|nr:hypothetical protein AAFF_G00012790 [Aldrovandia affinis]